MVAVGRVVYIAIITLAVLPLPASAWNIPGHMLSGIITYQILQHENPATIEKMNAVLEKHRWYAHQWQARLQDVSVARSWPCVVHADGLKRATKNSPSILQTEKCCKNGKYDDYIRCYPDQAEILLQLAMDFCPDAVSDQIDVKIKGNNL
jgi:hypothetical protein